MCYGFYTIRENKQQQKIEIPYNQFEFQFEKIVSKVLCLANSLTTTKKKRLNEAVKNQLQISLDQNKNELDIYFIQRIRQQQ